MGIKNTQFILVRHHNTDNPHCHLVYNRIDYNGKVISSQNDFKRNETTTLEDIFELNRNNEAINQMREDVETHEEAVRKQAALAEQARLKERAAKEQETTEILRFALDDIYFLPQ